MFNQLYIKKNIRKNFSDYLSMILIITISVVILNILNIYADSAAYGSRLDRIEMTKGFDIWIENASESDLAYFKNISGTEAQYDDGTIYVKFLNKYEDERIYSTVNRVISDNNLNVNIKNFSKMLKEADLPIEFSMMLNLLKIIFTAVGIICIYFVYSIFIDKRKCSLGILVSLGISEKQLKKLLFTELFVIYLISYILGITISNGLMFALIRIFLSVDNKNIVSIVYRFSVFSSVTVFILAFIAIADAFFISLKKILSIPIIETIRNENISGSFNRNVNIWNQSSAVKYIVKANILRNKKYFFICSVISIPVIVITLVFFSYFSLTNQIFDDSDFVVVVQSGTMDTHSDVIFEKTDELEKLKSSGEIQKIDFHTYYTNLCMKLDSSKLKFPVFRKLEDAEYILTSVSVLPYDAGNSDNSETENSVYLSNKLSSLKYQVGDEIYLYNSIYEGKFQTLTIAGILDLPQAKNSNALNLYVSRENFEKIVDMSSVRNEIYIYSNSDMSVLFLRDELNRIFSDSDLFYIIDNAKLREDSSQLIQGMKIIITFLCSVLFLCSIVLLWAFVSDYVTRNKAQTDVLFLIGAVNKAVTQITVYESLARGIFNTLTGIVLGTLLSVAVVKMRGYEFIMTPDLFAVYLLAAVITVSAHFLPSLIALKTHMKRGNNHDYLENITSTQNL